MKRLKQHYNKRIFTIFGGFFTYVLIIGIRLFYLQVFHADFYRKRGEKNFLQVEVLDSPRGNVIDCHGKLLAANRPVFDLYWQGSGKKRLEKKQHVAFENVAAIVEVDERELENLLHQIRRSEREGTRANIAKDLSFEQISQICEQCSHAGNLVITQRFKRIYPHKTLASHLLGYLGRDVQHQEVGQYGLEKLFHHELQGKPGYLISVTNAVGRKLVEKAYKGPTAGSTVHLTLDRTLQECAEEAFDKSFSGAFILMDALSGAIKVLLSVPGFDPNIFLQRISHQQWQENFLKNNPFFNRAINALYPPASIFKLITFTAGLEEGVIDDETVIECKGFILFGGRRYHCVRRWGHGALSCQEAIAHSCNIPCYEIAKRISINHLAQYAFRFGLGMKTDFILPERSGLVPTVEWKRATKGEPWWKGETLSSCLGQSYLLVTPLQIARMIGSICTGSLTKPRILADEQIISQPLDLDRKTIDFLRAAMKESVNSGTARALRLLVDFEIAAKTGTAQLMSLKQYNEDKKSLEHGWFASYFSYKGEDPFVMVVLTENTGTAAPALEIAKNFLRKYAEQSTVSKRE